MLLALAFFIAMFPLLHTKPRGVLKKYESPRDTPQAEGGVEKSPFWGIWAVGSGMDDEWHRR